MERFVGSFSAARPNGQIVVVEIYQQVRERAQLGQSSSELVPGKTSFRLQGGGTVFRIDEATFEVALSGEKLIASDCP